MKKLIFLAVASLFYINATAQETDSTTWKLNGSWGVNFANVGLENWAGGGVSSISIGTIFNAKAVKENNRYVWNNQFDFALGGIRQEGSAEGFTKTDDALVLISQYNRKFKDNWAWGITGVFRTQILQGFDLIDDPDNAGQQIQRRISNFLAPGYLSLNLGIEYKKGDVFGVSFAPAAGKFTFVTDDKLYDKLGQTTLFGVDRGDNVRAEFGSNLFGQLNLKLMENISFQSNLNLFSAYDSFGEIDVNWETLFVMKANKWFNATFGTTLIYDKDVQFATENGGLEDRVQFKHVLNIGVNFNLFSSGT